MTGNDFAYKTHQQHDKEQQSTILTSEFDVVKFIGTPEAQITKDKIVTSDMRLAKLSQKEEDYILEQITDANVIRNMLLPYGEEQANKVYKDLTIRPQLIGVVAVNREGNFLVEAILKNNSQKEEMVEEPPIRKEKPPKGKLKEGDDM